MARRLIFLLALYLTLDVANPMMPGALVLSVEDSVEVRMVQRLSGDDVAAVQASATDCLERVSTSVLVRAPVVVHAAPRPATRAPRRHVPASAPAPSPEED
jgi:hypothetical protein